MLLPPRLDNDYRGHPAAIFLFAFVVLARIGQSVVALVGGARSVMGADGIPLDSYPAAAAQTIVASYANYAVLRLFLFAVCVVVLFRYRSAIPAMLALLLLQFLAAQVLHAWMPVVRSGAAPAPLVNRVLAALMVIGLALSLWPRANTLKKSAVTMA